MVRLISLNPDIILSLHNFTIKTEIPENGSEPTSLSRNQMMMKETYELEGEISYSIAN